MPTDASARSSVSLPEDHELVEATRTGDAAALEQLLRRQGPWIYNLAFYMLHSRQDAEDATQEVLVKIATGLSGFRGASTFRTWARRIAVNHLIDCRRSRPEQVVTGFGCYREYLDGASESDIFEGSGATAEKQLLVDEARISCVLGMLLCLDRDQRLVFLLGEILEVSDNVGAELLELSRENFRQRLARARGQLSSFMRDRCSLVDPANPCRCSRKTAAFIRDGIVDANNLRFATGHLRDVSAVAGDRDAQLRGVLDRTREELRRLYPLFDAPDVVARLSKVLESGELRAALNLS